jgi:hypothetical protein
MLSRARMRERLEKYGIQFSRAHRRNKHDITARGGGSRLTL